MTPRPSGMRRDGRTRRWARNLETHLEVDVPVIALAIAALPAIALLLAVVARMESTLFGDAFEDGLLTDARLDDALLDDAAPEPVGQLTAH